MSRDHHDSSNIILCRGTRWMRNERNRSRRIACHRRSQCRATAAHLRIHHAFKISRRTLAWRCLAPFLAPSSSSPQNDRSVLVIPLTPPVSLVSLFTQRRERETPDSPDFIGERVTRSPSPQTPKPYPPNFYHRKASVESWLSVASTSSRASESSITQSIAQSKPQSGDARQE